MASNEQRRETAKQKLAQQLESREQQARRQRLLLIVGVVVLVIVVAAGVLWKTLGRKEAAAAPAGATVNCQYTPTGDAAKKVDPPRAGAVPTTPATVTASMKTNQGNIGLVLDNAKATCTVNSFASLAQKGYFDNTVCHRETSGSSLSVLQCGDPTGTGSGGPGYKFADEYPVADSEDPISYPAGTLAMANAGPGTNGSQFFLVYKDSKLPPKYTKFGTIDKTGMDTLAKIAANGITPGQNGPGDGAPKQEVKIIDLQID